jgi:hypothetical protein
MCNLTEVDVRARWLLRIALLLLLAGAVLIVMNCSSYNWPDRLRAPSWIGLASIFVGSLISYQVTRSR